MNLPRRKFLLKSALGILAASLLPASISFLNRKDEPSLIHHLFSQLSFNTRRLSLSNLNEVFNPTWESGDINRSEIILYYGKTVCIPETNKFIPGINEIMASIYEKTITGYKKVISLNQLELISFNNMANYLKTHHNICDPDELNMLLTPVLKTGKHKSNDNCIDSECSSNIGYYTTNGYCSMKIHAEGTNIIAQASLLNFEKIETYKNNFRIKNLI